MGKLAALTFLNLLLISSFTQPSTASPSLVKWITDSLFPEVTVALTNEASHRVYFVCKFKDEVGGLQRLEPAQSVTWSLREVLFPLRWCYVHINNEIRGAFWAFSVRSKCTNCSWIVRDDGVYRFNDENQWLKHNLFLE